MQAGILIWISEQEKGMGGRPGERCMKYIVMSTVLSSWEFLSFYKCIMVLSDINIRGSWVKSIQELCMIFATILEV